MQDFQNFDQEPDFNGPESAPGGADTASGVSERDEVPTALSSYLRSIHELPPISEELQRELGGAIASGVACLRESLSGFGFVLKEHIRLVAGIMAGTNHASEILSPSAMRRAGNNPAEIRKSLGNWHNELVSLYQEYRDIFFSAGKARAQNLTAVRARARETVSRYPLAADWYTGFVHSIGELFMTPLSGQLPAGLLDRFPPGELGFLCEKFFYDPEELPQAVAAAFGALHGLQEARGRMLEQNLRLVVTIAKGYASRVASVPINDIVQEGNLGLLRAIEKFDFDLGYRFSTYAIWWIKQNISRFLAEHSRIIRIPSHMIQTITAMNGAEQQFILENGREPLIEELAMALEMPVARINAIRKMARQPISLQAQHPGATGESGGTLEDILPDESDSSPSDILGDSVLNEQLHHVLSLLPERDQAIIVDRFGLFGHQVHTLAELSEKFNLTRERVRQLENRILRKLRSPEMLQYFDRSK